MTGSPRQAGLPHSMHSGEAAFLSEVRATRSVPAMPRAAWLLYLALLITASSLAWSSIAGVGEITNAPARVVPIMANQVVSNPEGGLLRELRVQEGTMVSAGQLLAQLDTTALEAQQLADGAERLGLSARLARLSAEASGKSPLFPKDVAEHPALVASESALFTTRKRALEEELAAMRRNIGRLVAEIRKAQRDAVPAADAAVAESTRQLELLRRQNQEHSARWRERAADEQAQTLHTMTFLQRQLDERAEALRRTSLRSPVGGLVTRMTSLKPGDAVAPGAALMEVVPVSSQVLIEARIDARQIGLLRVGQTAGFRLAGQPFGAEAELAGSIEYISPDAVADPNGGATRYHRAVVRAERSSPALADAALLVLPGMTGALEVHTGGRSVLGLLTLPLVKAREVFIGS